MELEIEVKILNIDLDSLKKELLDKGSSLISHEIQKNILITSSKYDLIDQNDYLRIRLVEDILNKKKYNYLTYKKLKSDLKYRKSEEYTISFDNLDNLKNILKFVSLDNFNITTKERLSYIYKDLRIDFDYWDRNSFPYDYVEVESPNEKILNDFLVEFGIDKKNISTKSIVQLKEEFERR